MPNVPKWIDEVLRFWFEETAANVWFARDDALDAEIRRRFGALHASLTEKVPATVSASPLGALAAVIVLDQFSRNLFRNSSRAFTTDPTALAITEEVIASGFDRDLNTNQRIFLYMPLQHSEDLSVQRRSLELFGALGDSNSLDYARQHYEIIERFGRFPHRNRVLGRQSTAEEGEFLKTHPGF
jgi:uncharacterized protein (DUF924 family)